MDIRASKMLAILAAAILILSVFTAAADDTRRSGVPDPCMSTASGAGGCLLICPSGDGDRLEDVGGTITVVINDANGLTVPGYPFEEIWVEGCSSPGIIHDGLLHAVLADADTDANGQTTISGPLEAGGQDVGLTVWISGAQICNTLSCLSYDVRSPDINGDKVVDLVDFADFASGYTTVTKPYRWEFDFNCDGEVDLVDLSLFSEHYLHT